jgi:D-glycero-alpha-D-manno-heptose-7-phosphate kinase
MITPGDPFQQRFYARAPMRLSLAGGGTDVGTYPDEFGGAVISCAITIYASVSVAFNRDSRVVIREAGQVAEYESFEALRASGGHEIVRAVLQKMNRREGGVEVCLFSGTQPRSGLGGSAALFVALISLFSYIDGEYGADHYALANLAWALERDELQNLGGRQDQHASVFGGLNYIEFLKSDVVRVTPLRVAPNVYHHLESNLLLFWCGDRARSGGVIEDQIKNIRNRTNIESLHRAKKLTQEMKAVLLQGNVRAVGALLEAGWQAKKGFSPMVSTPEIDRFHDELMKAGMVGGRLTGAGGGGHFLAYAELEDRQRVIDTAVCLGAQYVPFGFEPEGVVAWSMPRDRD